MLYISEANKYENDLPLPNGASIMAFSLCINCSNIISAKYNCCGLYVKFNFSVISVYRSFKVPSKLAVGALKSDRKSTRLNSSHVSISYAVFCLKKKKQ